MKPKDVWIWRSLMACWAWMMSSDPAQAATYRAGDIVRNFTLTDRATRKPVNLTDLEGKIIFLEWFAWWCPFCQAAAPQVEEGIVQWYASRGGNPNGVPVMHVAINLQPNQETQTQNFLNRAGFQFVLEDFNRALANQFQSGGQPIFAIINGVTDSPSHAAWELLAHQNGYGQRDFSESLTHFRSVMDRVQAAPATPPPPTLVSGPAAAEVQEGEMLTLSVVADGADPLTYQWLRDGVAVPGATAAQFVVTSAQIPDAGSYAVTVSNPGGVITSAPAVVTVRTRPLPVPRLSSILRTADGMISVEIAEAGGGTPVLEHSSDLIQWRQLKELTPGVPNQQVLIAPGTEAVGFFRVRTR